MSDTETEIAVIGAGQAGLAMGYHLGRMKADFVLLDAAEEVGSSWRDRWDSLRLFTPARYNGLPGRPFPGPRGHHPGKDAVARYLAEYAARFELPVRLGTEVTGLTGGDGFTVTTSRGPVRAAQVVLATGPYQEPCVPGVALGLAGEVPSLHSADYRNPERLPGGTVVVVGAGNSGAQIAAELAAADRRVVLAGRERPQLPQRFMGSDVFQWFDRLGMLHAPVDVSRAQRSRGKEPVIGTDLRALARGGSITRVGRLVAVDGDRLEFEDGVTVAPAAVVWATGYRTYLPWLDAALLDERGAPLHDQGRCPMRGLHLLGLPWMTHRASALLAGVGRDAALVARRIAAARPVR
ncbi:flavin-containing monooxygenase [Spirillospora sp. CA-294931]|uniref:flavin-containing monooxygenase n=1 Tax=Spirillospora sp. CA-294931 TaxID=3240042 RepID=UPI003D8DF49B